MGSWKLKIKAEIKLKSWKIHLRKIPEELGKKDRQKIGKKKKKNKTRKFEEQPRKSNIQIIGISKRNTR